MFYVFWTLFFAVAVVLAISAGYGWGFWSPITGWLKEKLLTAYFFVSVFWWVALVYTWGFFVDWGKYAPLKTRIVLGFIGAVVVGTGLLYLVSIL